MSDLIFEEVRHRAYDFLRLALKTARLPIDDLDAPGCTFYKLSDQTGPIGYVGLEGGGADRLVRSLVVLNSRRGQGHGAQLLHEIERWALEEEAERLHLLTTNRAVFFEKHGYRRVDRENAPSAIRGTAQFATICPASAAYLVKELA